MTFSVIVPTYNRVSLLKNTLDSLFAQDCKDFEIIVVNDGSTDSTDEYMRLLAAEKKVTYLRHENQGLAATRLAGLNAATGKYVAFTDDDCVLPRTWLSRFLDIFQEQHAVCVGGDCITGNPGNPYALANDLMQSYFKEAAHRLRNSTPFFTGNNVAYTREVLQQVGGPDRRFRMGAEDRDLLYRVAQTGGNVVYAPSIAIHHFNDSSFTRFVRHQFEFGEGSYLYYHRTAMAGKRPSSFPLPVYLGVFFSPFRKKFSSARATFLMMLIVLAQGTITAGYVARWLRGVFVRPDNIAALA